MNPVLAFVYIVKIKSFYLYTMVCANKMLRNRSIACSTIWETMERVVFTHCLQN